MQKKATHQPVMGTGDSEKSSNKTFRIRNSIIGELQAQADKNGVSLNTFVNAILHKQVEWDRYAAAAEMVSILPNMLGIVLGMTATEAIEEMAKRVVTESCFKDSCLMIFKRYDLETFFRMVSFLDMFGNSYRVQLGNHTSNGRGAAATPVSLSELSRGGIPNIALYHNYGRNWSIFVGEILHGELLRLGVDHVYERSNNVVVYRFGDNAGAGEAATTK